MRPTGLALIDPFFLLEQLGVGAGWTVADLGCGSLGHFVFPAATLVGAEGRVYAVDVQRHAITRLEHDVRDHQAWHIRPIWADIEAPGSTSVPPSSVDLTLIVNTLYLARERARWIEEAWRITRPDGQLMVIDWRPEAAPLGPAQEMRLHPDELRDFICARNWQLEEDIDVGDHHFGCLFRRPAHFEDTQVESLSYPS